jgi:hypothetical protein
MRPTPWTLSGVQWMLNGVAGIAGWSAQCLAPPTRWRGCLVVLAAATAAGFPASPAAASDATIKASILRAVADIRNTPSEAKLDGRLARVLTRLRSDRGSTAAGRTARTLAIGGLTWTRRGLQARLDFIRNDSGNLPAAVRDARAADRRLKRGAALLRSAGKALGVRIGMLNGY